jgi:integrase
VSVKGALNEWTTASGITEGCIFRSINKVGRIWGTGMTPKVLWEVIRQAAKAAEIERLAPHDLRRTCARLCHLAGGQLDQIQFLLGHVSIQTTERYLGCKQELRYAVNDKLGLDKASAPTWCGLPASCRPARTYSRPRIPAGPPATNRRTALRLS